MTWLPEGLPEGMPHTARADATSIYCIVLATGFRPSGVLDSRIMQFGKVKRVKRISRVQEILYRSSILRDTAVSFRPVTASAPSEDKIRKLLFCLFVLTSSIAGMK